MANLQVREKDARDDAREAEEKLMALIERARMDAMKAKWLRKEWDDLLWAIEELYMGTQLVC